MEHGQWYKNLLGEWKLYNLFTRDLAWQAWLDDLVKRIRYV